MMVHGVGGAASMRARAPVQLGLGKVPNWYGGWAIQAITPANSLGRGRCSRQERRQLHRIVGRVTELFEPFDLRRVRHDRAHRLLRRSRLAFPSCLPRAIRACREARRLGENGRRGVDTRGPRRAGSGPVMRCLTIALILLFATGGARADAWPERPVRMIAPFPAGGAVDLMARLAADVLARALGQPVFVDNRPGAGGNLGAELLAQAGPDGYTLRTMTIGSPRLTP